MRSQLRVYFFVSLTVLTSSLLALAKGPLIRIDRPLPPPNWALLQRALIQANTDACKEFYGRYFDEKGFLMCVERWGGDDGPDDAIENCNGWPILHTIGADNAILRMYRKAWEGHLRQFTIAKTTHVPFAKDGMYYKEFPVMFDWQHNAEGLSVFNLQGLSDPYNGNFRKRVRRFAGFYMNEDPGAPNYDAKHKIIRSLFNGSRGPLLRKATALDWTGDPIEVLNRFTLGHNERSYKEMLAHFKDYNDIVGDHPLNLLATTLHLNAYMMTGQLKYRRWLLGYVDAWLARMKENKNVIPSNIGLDGKIGSECGGRWYGGTYGWSFTVTVPQDGSLAHRNRQHWGFIGFANAYLLTGDDRYLDAWRKQADVVNGQKKVVKGKAMYPRMYGDKGWYNFQPTPYTYNALEIYYLSMKASDRKRAGNNAWLSYLDGKNPAHPERALRAELMEVRRRVQGMRNDKTTPDTRLSDDPMKYNPARVNVLTNQMLGGIHIERRASVLHCRVRYFDIKARRAGIPTDVAALVEKLTPNQMVLSLVNTSQLESKRFVVQAGGYSEHQFLKVTRGGRSTRIDDNQFEVQMAPGTGQRLVIDMRRYANRPTLHFPWNRQ